MAEETSQYLPLDQEFFASQPIPRLCILDLPDELLRKIFLYVKGAHVHDNSLQLTAGVSCIQNLRLTCQRFCNTSSHLLIKTIRVELNAASIAHLERVSQHPTISKGVQTVRILVHLYEELRATDIREFAISPCEKLALEIMDLEQQYEQSESFGLTGQFENNYHVPQNEVPSAITKAKMINHAWQLLADGHETASSKEFISYQKPMFAAHEEYHRRFAEQERWRENRHFSQTISGFFTKIPTATRLEFHDDDSPEPAWNLRDFIGPNLATMDWLTLPSTWENARKHGNGRSLTEILLELPCAIHEAGSHLTSLIFQVSCPEDLSFLAPDDKVQSIIEASIQHLKHFRFAFHSHLDISFSIEGLSSGEIQSLCKFLKSFTNTNSLEQIHIDLRNFCDFGSPHTLSVGSIITFRKWEKLDRASLFSIPIHFTELKFFFKQLKSHMQLLSLDGIRLLSGSWVDVLDIFREKRPQVSSISSPAGGEVDELSWEDHIVMFGKNTGNGPSRSELYIQGYITENPLRDIANTRGVAMNDG